MVGNYIILGLCCFGIFAAMFKIRNATVFRLLVIVACANGILISIAKLLSLTYVLGYPIAVLGICTFVIMTYGIWQVRKIPEKKTFAYAYLIGIPCLALFTLIMYLLIESGVFGE